MNRPRDLVLPALVVDRLSRVALHQQVRVQIARAIRAGLPAGSCLPSTRLLARLLGVSRNTVLAAYDELAADGLIRGRRGAGMVVATAGAGLARVPASWRVLRDAQFPSRTLYVADQDGTIIALTC